MIVKCTTCGQKYNHGMRDGERLTCPSCGGSQYSKKQAPVTAEKKQLQESAGPRLLQEG